MVVTTGADVKKVWTSYDVMNYQCPSVMSLMLSTKCCVFCMWYCDVPTRGFRMPFITFLSHPTLNKCIGKYNLPHIWD